MVLGIKKRPPGCLAAGEGGLKRPKSRSWLPSLVLLCGAGLAASPLPAQIPDESCEADGGYRALDFLLGEWRLVSGGETVGRGKVEKLEGGCLIAETWSFVDGGSGRTYSSFDRAAGVWRRFGVSNRGVIVRSDGTFDGDEFTFEGEYVAAAGRTSNWRERLTREADGRIARIAGTSRRTDRGDRPSTVLFEGHYVPVVPPAVERSAAPVSVEVETADPDSPPTAEEPAKLATAREHSAGAGRTGFGTRRRGTGSDPGQGRSRGSGTRGAGSSSGRGDAGFGARHGCGADRADCHGVAHGAAVAAGGGRGASQRLRVDHAGHGPVPL